MGNAEGAGLGAVGLAVGSSVGGAPTGSMHDSAPGARVTLPEGQALQLVAPKVSMAVLVGHKTHELSPGAAE